MVAELAAARAEIERLRGLLAAAGVVDSAASESAGASERVEKAAEGV